MTTILNASAVSRRRFLTFGSLAFAGTLASHRTFAQEGGDYDLSDEKVLPQKDGAFVAAPLPYAFDALEPSIDAETMRLHHNKHYQGYTDKLNAALEKHPELQKKSIEELLGNIKALPEDVRKAIRNNGGGFYNHSLFWVMMTPDGAKAPEGALADAINKKFGSLEKFQDQFNEEAKSVFGSGWAWLIVNKNGELEITSTPNQDSPIMSDVAEAPGKPVLALDVWEHSYYLKYKNVRPDYITNWWKVVNWKTAEEMYKKATA